MRSSLEILLDTTPPEPYGRNFMLIPLSRGETFVARQGLANRFSYYFNKDRKKLDEDERLMAVYNFLTGKIDRYRTEARNIAKALEVSSDTPDLSFQALALSAIMVAQEARRKNWPKKSLLQEIQELKFQEALALGPEDFAATRVQAAHIAIENDRYWVSQLEASRGHYVVPMFKKATAEADPEEVAV